MGRAPIARAPTGVAAFLGVADGEAALVGSWQAFTTRFSHGSALATAVETFFLAGGELAWVAPLPLLAPEHTTSAIDTMHPDVALVAVVGDQPPPAPVVAAAAASLSRRRAMLLMEGPWPDAAAAATASDLVTELGVSGKDAAAYWPRLHRSSATGTVDTISPLGAVAGAIAMNDRARGIWTAASGPRGALPGILSPAATTTRQQRDALDARNINVIAAFPERGTLVWGARTLSTDPEWRYMPVRRMALFLEESLSRGLAWAVFEPNDELLWNAVREDVGAFMHDLWRDSAFAGRTPRDAYFVACDRSTMTDADLAAGDVVCMVGFAPIRPAEFVVLRIRVRTD